MKKLQYAPEEFDVIFVPGGFGVFEDLGANPASGMRHSAREPMIGRGRLRGNA